jgi:hypothetical protein
MRLTMWDTVHSSCPESRVCSTWVVAPASMRSNSQNAVSTSLPPIGRRRWSSARGRVPRQRAWRRVSPPHLGIQQLDKLEGEFDGIYSNFGPLNCAPDLGAVAAECARLLRPGGDWSFR